MSLSPPQLPFAFVQLLYGYDHDHVTKRIEAYSAHVHDPTVVRTYPVLRLPERGCYYRPLTSIINFSYTAILQSLAKFSIFVCRLLATCSKLPLVPNIIETSRCDYPLPVRTNTVLCTMTLNEQQSVIPA